MELEDSDARGKHRILAELGRVEEEVRFLEVISPPLPMVTLVPIIYVDILY